MKRKKKKDKPYLIEQKCENDKLIDFMKERVKFYKMLRKTQFANDKKGRKQLKEAMLTLEFTIYLWEKER